MNPQKKILNSLLSSISVLVTICSSNYLGTKRFILCFILKIYI